MIIPFNANMLVILIPPLLAKASLRDWRDQGDPRRCTVMDSPEVNDNLTAFAMAVT